MMDVKEKLAVFNLSNEGFVDLGFYQYGWSSASPCTLACPHARTIICSTMISGTGRLQSTDSQGVTTEYQILVRAGILI